MIYVSSACSSYKRISDAVQELAEQGITNIELTGGTNYYNGYEQDLKQLQEKYSLQYLVHNYFPPPTDHFVLNLASLDQAIYQKSLEHCLKAIQLSKKFNCQKLGFHAGFLINVKVKEIGQKIRASQLSDKDKSLSRFQEAWEILQKQANSGVILYLENNVLSLSNYQSFNGINPLLMTDSQGYLELQQYLNFYLLLDVAHLKVSCNSLDLNFDEQLDKLIPLSNYVHLSDNDGKHDQNKGFTNDCELLHKLKKYDFTGKTITLEIYRQVETIQEQYQLIRNTLNIN